MLFMNFSLLFILLFHIVPKALNGEEDKKEALKSSKPEIHQLPLDRHNQYRLFWTVDYEASAVTIEVRANLRRRDDWFALGFSDYGNITEADLCVLWFDRQPKAHFQVRKPDF